MSLIVFAVCLMVGGLRADNPFATTVLRALAAMGGTLVVGLIVGLMGQKMLDENLPSSPGTGALATAETPAANSGVAGAEKEKLEKSQAKSAPRGR